METQTYVPPTQERQKSFDVLASIDLYRFDLQTIGHIHPETRQRVYDEELVYIAEGINRPLTTEFHLKRQGGDLIYFHNGSWRPYLSTLVKGLETATEEARQDVRKSFMAERAAQDLEIGYRLTGLKPGEKLNWYSEFPYKETANYGETFIEDLGYQPCRCMGFLYQAVAGHNGEVTFFSQSVDNSDDQAFETSMIRGMDSSSDIDDLRDEYDKVLYQKHGREFYAGRQIDKDILEENAWSVIGRHSDLLEHFYFAKIEELAGQYELTRSELERAKKRLTYGVWAALKERLDKEAVGLLSLNTHTTGDWNDVLHIQQEVDRAYEVIAARGEVLFGCGGAIRGRDATLEASPHDVFNSIFSEHKWMNCPFCGARQHGNPCASHIKCSECKAEVKDRKVISRGNGGKRAREGTAKGVADIFHEAWTRWNRQYDDEQMRKNAQKQNANNSVN